MVSKPVTPEQFKNGVWLIVDPGVHTAWEIWESGTPICNGILPGEGKEINRLTYLGKLFDRKIYNNKPDGVIIEGLKVLSFTSVMSGSLFIPAYLIGIYCYICSVNFVPFYILDPQWRGNLADRELKRILEIKYKMFLPNEHLRDVRAMGLCLSGKF